ncbi:MAG: glycosyltransferase family 2 protein [Ignavibacteriales bacterium]|nr:glycosyltransferase family 2 protein [Ignavibacteriales bacterium]MCF8306278.1 glycosyltransferase family 2 protein [Ignavibacteriales bacterium]MCF8315999.1 glycosyltransferase family 2 protein [Ignavibacteriales bacterium]MCF8437593.1 glycosyltransferase family 2 protein [Ignavibacteriales bacterium]
MFSNQSTAVYSGGDYVVSIILPTYNRASLLKRAVDSVLQQNYCKYELIIVDDGSTDNTFEIIRDLQKTYPNIRYLRHSNRQLPLSLNAGLLASVGEFVTFLGSDDEYKPEHLENRISFFKNDPDLDFIHGGVDIIGYPFVKDKYDLSKMIHVSDCVVGGTFFGKRSVFLENGGFRNIKYSEDSEFFERIKDRYRIKRVNLPTYIYYRDTPDSICSTIV